MAVISFMPFIHSFIRCLSAAFALPTNNGGGLFVVLPRALFPSPGGRDGHLSVVDVVVA